MTVPFLTPFRDALADWRRDRAVLAPLAGLTMFVPQLGVLLLVPSLPRPPAEGGEAAVQLWSRAVTDWAGDYGLWFVLAPLIGLFGSVAAMVFYGDRSRPALGTALARAARLVWRYLLATILVGAAALALLVPGAISRALLAVLIAPAFYVLGRTMIVGPVIVGAAPIGAVAAINRSWRLTKGRGWLSAATYALPLFVAQMLGTIVLGLGAAGGNPVLATIAAVAAALVTTAAALTLTLAEIALYRRLAASSGI